MCSSDSSFLIDIECLCLMQPHIISLCCIIVVPYSHFYFVTRNHKVSNMHPSSPKGYSGRSRNPPLPQSGMWNPRDCTIKCAFSPAACRASFMRLMVFRLVQGPNRQFSPTTEAPVQRNTFIYLFHNLLACLFFKIEV